jgi:hypothetical protein
MCPVFFEFQAHDFEPSYQVEAQPEFPPDGGWTEPLFCYDRDGRLIADPPTRWGAPFVVRVKPAAAPVWVGMFEAGILGRGGAVSAHACPRSDQLCVVVSGLAYLVDTDAPQAGAAALDLSVTKVVATVSPPFLLLVTYSSVVALGPTGVAWQSDRIALDGLTVEAIRDGRLYCKADNLEGGYDDFVLDAATGEQVAGPRFRDSWPPDALA